MPRESRIRPPRDAGSRFRHMVTTAITHTSRPIARRRWPSGPRQGFRTFIQSRPRNLFPPSRDSGTQPALEGCIALREHIFADQIAHVGEDDLESRLRTRRVPVITEFGSLRSDHDFDRLRTMAWNRDPHIHQEIDPLRLRPPVRAPQSSLAPKAAAPRCGRSEQENPLC